MPISARSCFQWKASIRLRCSFVGAHVAQWDVSRVHNPQSVQRLIQLCIGSWSSGIGSSDVMRTLHTSARPVSRQGTSVFDPRVPATPRVPLRCVWCYDAKIRFRSTKTLCRAGLGIAHSGGYVLLLLCIHFPSLGFAGQVHYNRTHLDTNSA